MISVGVIGVRVFVEEGLLVFVAPGRPSVLQLASVLRLASVAPGLGFVIGLWGMQFGCGLRKKVEFWCSLRNQEVGI